MGTPLGPKYIPYTCINPLGEAQWGWYDYQHDDDNHNDT